MDDHATKNPQISIHILSQKVIFDYCGTKTFVAIPSKVQSSTLYLTIAMKIMDDFLKMIDDFLKMMDDFFMFFRKVLGKYIYDTKMNDEICPITSTINYINHYHSFVN